MRSNGGGIFRGYQRTWRDSGQSSRLILLGTALYAMRLQAFFVVFPLFAKERGFDAGDIGLVTSANWASLVLFGLPVTWLGNRGMARGLLAVGPLISALGLIAIVAAPAASIPLVFAGCLLTGFSGTTFWILADPILVGDTAINHRGRLFALKFFCLIASGAVGGLIGGWLPSALGAGGFSTESRLTWTLIALASIDLVASAVFRSLPIVPGALRATGRRQTIGRAGWLSPILLILVVPEICMAVGVNSIKPFMSLFLDEGRGLSSGAAGTIIGLMSLAGGFGSLLMPSVVARAGSIRSLLAFRVIGGLLVLSWFAGVGVLLLIPLICLVFVNLDGTEAVYITDAMGRVTPEQRTLLSGLYAMAWSIASFGAANLSGQLQDVRDGAFDLAFTVGVVGYVLSGLWIGLVFPRLPRSHTEPDQSLDSFEPSGSASSTARELATADT